METNARDWLSLPQDKRQLLINRFVDGQNHTDYIKLVAAGELGVYASLGIHFDYAVFGRDSLQVAEDLLGTHKNLVEKIIITAAQLQGVKNDSRSEEEPGKIHHEFRAKVFDGQLVPEVSQNIMQNLQKIWGDERSETLCYYGSYDATPLFIRLLGNYTERYGAEFLDHIYQSKLGHRRIKDALRSALEWLVAKVQASDWKLLEYKRLNLDSGIGNQAWKDSGTSYLHSNGEVANYDGGIASIELQGLAYDALKVGANLVANDEVEKTKWLKMAQDIQTQTIGRLWLEDQQYFGQGLDRAPDGQARVIDTLTSNPAAMLDSGLLADLQTSDRQKYVDAIINAVTSREFMTPAGVRCRALKHKQMPGFVDYHGSYTVWPKETYSIAKGLRRHNKPELAKTLEDALVDSVIKAGEFYEFFYVNDDNHVWYNRSEAINHLKSIGLGENLAVPESGQAWTISAFLGIHDNTLPNQAV